MIFQILAIASPQFQLDASLERRAAAGREQLELLKRDAASSPCWEAALSKLETGCRALDDETQSRLAIAFTNCHLAKSFLPTLEIITEKDLQPDLEGERPLFGLPAAVIRAVIAQAFTACSDDLTMQPQPYEPRMIFVSLVSACSPPY